LIGGVDRADFCPIGEIGRAFERIVERIGTGETQGNLVVRGNAEEFEEWAGGMACKNRDKPEHKGRVHG
jgi:hypothetical protein